MKILLFLAFPILEFYLLIRVGAEVGALKVVLWCIASTILGGWVVKRHGLNVVARMQAELMAGQQPQESILSATMIFLAGVLLVLPGFITDAVGFLLLIPFVRVQLAGPIRNYMAAQARKTNGPADMSNVFFLRNFGQRQRPPFESGENYENFDSRAGYQEENDEPRQVTIIDVTPGKIDHPGESGAGHGSRREGNSIPENERKN